VSTTVLLLPEFLQISLRMTRWSSRSTTFRRAFVHHVRGPYSLFLGDESDAVDEELE